jgi:hypothetical protein
MRIVSALALCACLLASPALARGHHHPHWGHGPLSKKNRQKIGEAGTAVRKGVVNAANATGKAVCDVATLGASSKGKAGCSLNSGH